MERWLHYAAERIGYSQTILSIFSMLSDVIFDEKIMSLDRFIS